MSGYECRNRQVFSLRRNTGNDGADVMSSALGPAEANGWSPTVTSRDGRMSSRLEDITKQKVTEVAQSQQTNVLLVHF